jgi:hypothetical protein
MRSSSLAARMGADREQSQGKEPAEIMAAFVGYLNVPEAHLKDHSAIPAFESVAPDARHTVVRIHSGNDKPASALAAVHYRDYWFWIDDGDLPTKRALTANMFFFTLA